MAKPNFKDLLLAKGEKIGMIAGGVIAGLIAVGGVMSIADAANPDKKAKEFDAQAQRLDAGVRAAGEAAPDLPKWVVQAGTPKPIPPQEFALAGPPFEPLYTPDPRRQNPKVVGIVGYQFDLLRAPMRALDIHETGDGTILIGAKVDKPTAEKDRTRVSSATGDAIRGLMGDRGRKPKTSSAPRPAQPGSLTPPTGGGVPPGAQPPGTGAPTGVQPPGPGGGGGPRGGGLDNPYGAMMSGTQVGQRDDKAVEYLTPQQIQERSLPLAETVYPARLLLVHALFPLKLQLDEIKEALRLDNQQQAITESSMNGQIGPVFDGFEVQRQTTYPDGAKSEWAFYDHEYEYATKLRTRMWASQPDTGFLTYFLRPYQQKLAAPLPQLADQLGTYPNLRIPQILEAEKKMRESGKQPVTQTEWEKRFLKPGADDNPFAPIGTQGGGAGGAAAAGGVQPPGGMQGFIPKGPPAGTAPPVAPPPGGGVPSPDGQPPRGGTLQPTTPTGGLDSDYLLLRFIDPDVKPGHTYQYRIRVKMKNPNFNKADKVARPDEAKVEVLNGVWVEIGGLVHVPTESFLFAGDPAKYLEHVTALADRYGKDPAIRNLMDERAVQEGKKAVVQVQQWTPQIRLDTGNKTEPIGTWVVSDLAVSPGEYIGKRQLVELPLWSAGLGNYVLRELTSGVKVWGIRDARNQPKGWPVNFRTQSVLVDFDGGRVKTRVNDKEVLDDAATELLILRPDGKMLVRNSATDGADAQRAERTTKWDEWLKRVRDRKGGPGGGAAPKPGDPDYGRPGTGTPGGGTGSPG